MTELHHNGKGRPSIHLTEEDKAQVEKLSTVLTKVQLAHYFGMGETRYRELEEEDSKLSEAYKRGKSKAIASVAGNLVNQAREGNTSAAIFYLKTQAGWKETAKTEISGVDGEPIKIQEVSFTFNPVDEND